MLFVVEVVVARSQCQERYKSHPKRYNSGLERYNSANNTTYANKEPFSAETQPCMGFLLIYTHSLTCTHRSQGTSTCQ